MNKVMLVGRLTAKPELRYTGSNTAFLRFTVAVNRPFANSEGKREADFINVVAWRKQAETIAKYFDKGNLIGIEGRLQTGSYDDQNGNKRYTTDVQLDNFEFVEGKKDAQASAEAGSPYDFQDEGVSVQDDPFAEYGDSVSIDDSFLD